MPKRFILTFMSALSLLFSCQYNPDKADNNSDNILFSKWDTIAIRTGGNPLSIHNAPIIYRNDNVELYVNYNNTANSLNLYSLDSLAFVLKIEFYSSGPNKATIMGEYNLFDSLVVVKKHNRIQLINFSGEVVEELTLRQMCPEMDEHYSLRTGGGVYFSNLRRLFLNPATQSVIFRTYNKENGYENIYKNPCFCEYNFDTQKGTAYRVKFPDELSHEYYGDLEYPNIILKGDSIIYNFPFKAAVYIYNMKTQKTEVREFEANHIPSVAEGKPLNGKKDVMTKSEILSGPKYHQIDYDPHTNLYYMLYSQKRIKDKPTPKYLIVFDKDLKKLGEIDIDPEFYPEFAISKRGLLFRNKDDYHFDTLTLHVLNVNVSTMTN